MYQNETKKQQQLQCMSNRVTPTQQQKLEKQPQQPTEANATDRYESTCLHIHQYSYICAFVCSCIQLRFVQNVVLAFPVATGALQLLLLLLLPPPLAHSPVHVVGTASIRSNYELLLQQLPLFVVITIFGGGGPVKYFSYGPVRLKKQGNHQKKKNTTMINKYCKCNTNCNKK